MSKLTLPQAQAALQLHANNNTLTIQQLSTLLQGTSITFGQIVYVTKVQVAAAHKAQNIQKVTSANVILCSNIAAHTSVYANRVRKSATRLGLSAPSEIAAFVPQANYYEHTATHCLVKHREHADKWYLYVLYNSANSMYIHNGVEVAQADVEQYMTPSAVRALYTSVVHNVTHNVTHGVAMRTIALSNIVSVTARKQLLTV